MSDDTAPKETPLEWTVWPARQRPVLSAAVAVIIIGLSVAVVLSYDNMWFGVMAFIGLFFAVASHYLPTTYRLTKKRATLRTPLSTKQREWDAVAAVFTDEAGILLSPRPKLTWIAQRRGLYLRCPDNFDTVMNFVTQHVSRDGTDNDRSC
ncbi:MAG: hypothetical protein R6V19_18130 [Armatimonadota bacterium]